MSRREPLVLLLCFLVASLEGFDIQAFGITAPRLIVEFHLGPAWIGAAGSAAMIGMVGGAAAGGWLAQRWSLKFALIASTLLFAGFSLLTAFAQTPTELIAARLFTGLGFGGAMPNLLAVATRLRPGGRHAGAATLIFCGMPVGGALVAACAGWLGDPLPWRTLYLIGGGAPLVVAAALAIWLPAFPPAAGKQGGDDRLHRVLLGPDYGLTTLALWLAFIAALLLLYLLLNWLPLLVIGKGFTPAFGSRAALFFNASGIVGALVAGRWADRVGYRTPVWVATLLLVSGLVVMSAAHDGTVLLVAACLLGAATVSAQYLLYAAAPLPYPAGQSIVAAGVAIGVGRLGSIAGPLLAGATRSAGVPIDTLLIGLVPVALVVGAGMIIALRRAGAMKGGQSDAS
ncbi:MAG: MFS transporter [Janthinobacterium lividum]